MTAAVEGVSSVSDSKEKRGGSAVSDGRPPDGDRRPEDADHRLLDVKGLHCPLPILRTRALLDTMPEGELLEVHATDPASVIDFKHFCNTTDNEMVEHAVTDGVYVYRIRRGVM